MSVKGKIKDISLIEWLQLMQLSQKTGRLEIQFEKQWAMIIFKEGVLWHVEPRGFGGIAPEEVIYTLMGWKDADVAFQRVEVLPSFERSVHVSIDNFIFEGAKRFDEAQSTIMEEAPATTATAAAAVEMVIEEKRVSDQFARLLKLKPGAEAKVRSVPQSVKRVLVAIDGHRSISEVIAKSELDAQQATQIIKELIMQEVLETLDPPKVDAAHAQ